MLFFSLSDSPKSANIICSALKKKSFGVLRGKLYGVFVRGLCRRRLSMLLHLLNFGILCHTLVHSTTNLTKIEHQFRHRLFLVNLRMMVSLYRCHHHHSSSSPDFSRISKRVLINFVFLLLPLFQYGSNFFSFTLLKFNLFSFAYKSLDVGLLVEVLMNQLLCEPLIKYQHMVVLVEALSIHAHEGEKFWVHHFLGLQDTHLIREYLAKVGSHFFWLFI